MRLKTTLSDTENLLMRRSVVFLVGLLIGFVALIGPFVAPASAADEPAERRFLDLINQERRNNGMREVVLRPEIVPVARLWTARMISEQRLYHNDALATQLPSDWTRLGENVGYGGGVDSLHVAFMNSPGHRANVLGDFNQVGIGVDYDSRGRMWVTIDFIKSNVVVAQVMASSSQPSSSTAAPVCGASPSGSQTRNGATGYHVLGADGGVFSYGNAANKGSIPQLGLRVDAVLMTLTPSQQGYWIAGRDGGIFSFGDAAFHGSVPGLRLGAPVTAIDLKPTPTGRGYWILGADGGIFSFGDAKFFGSLPGVGVRNQAVRLVPTGTGNGYWILGADGGIFSFGDAQFFGSVPGIGLRATGISMARNVNGNGYWILGNDGGIFSFGDAPFYGSVPGLKLCDPVQGVQLSPTPGGAGYYIVSDRGRVFAFGDAPFLGEPFGYGPVARDIQAVSN